MTDAPSDKSPFWRFSLKFYGVPGVAQACIELQDEAGVDVNVLLFLLWQASQSRAFDRSGVEAVEAQIGPWRDMAVVPLRAVRRALRNPPPVLVPAVAEEFRSRIKAVELEAERLQQDAMSRLAQSGLLGREAGSPQDAARSNVEAYEQVLRPFPAGARGTILNAFAKFDPPV